MEPIMSFSLAKKFINYNLFLIVCGENLDFAENFHEAERLALLELKPEMTEDDMDNYEQSFYPFFRKVINSATLVNSGLPASILCEAVNETESELRSLLIRCIEKYTDGVNNTIMANGEKR